MQQGCEDKDATRIKVHGGSRLPRLTSFNIKNAESAPYLRVNSLVVKKYCESQFVAEHGHIDKQLISQVLF